MKLVIFDDLPEGGAKRVVYEQVKGLSKHHSVVSISNTLPTMFPFEKYATVHHFDLNLIEESGLKRPLQELSYFSKIVPTFHKINDLIHQIDPDIVIVHPSRFSQAPELIGLISCPTVYFAEETLRVVYEPSLHPLPKSWVKRQYELIRRKWLKSIDFRAVKAATSVVCASSYVKKALWNAYRRRAAVIPLGVDTKIFKPSVHASHRDYFLFVGEKEIINGYPLIAPFEKKFPIKYVIFKQNRFRFSDSDMARLYQHAIATLCLAQDEPFGLAAIESMACGTPVIAVNSGGYVDTVQTGRTGIVINRNEDELLHAMESMIKHSGKMGTQARDRACMQFGWDRHILMLEEKLKEVLR